MVTKEQIRTLPRKYAIGKRPLSRVLGWGELTYTRIIDGATPTEEHANEIAEMLEIPLKYIMLLDKAYENGLIVESSYVRSRKAAESCLGESADKHDAMKLHAVARYLCVLSKGDITPRALQSLVYFCHGALISENESKAIEELPVASDNGPEYAVISDWFNFDRIQEEKLSSEAVKLLSKKQIKCIMRVYEEYGIYSSEKLAEIARSQGPWKKARKRMESDQDDRGVITLKSMKKQFLKEKK